MTDLPKTIYAKHEEDPNDEDEKWLMAYDNLDAIAPDVGDTEEVGVYELVKVVRVTTSVTAEDLVEERSD